MAKLIVIDGPDTGSEFELDAKIATSSTAGRDPATELPLKDTAVSRKHFRLEWSQGHWRVVDLGSRNQTFVNGRPVKEVVLRHGDLVGAGDTEMRFEDPGAPVESAGVHSTIIKEMPAASRHNSLVERLESIEKALALESTRLEMKSFHRLLELYGDVGSATSSQEVIDRLLEEIVNLLEADRGAVILPEKGQWVVRLSRSARRGPASPSSLGEGLRASTSVIEKVVKEGKAILSADTMADERFQRKESIVEAEIASVVAAPIEISEKTVGILYADRRGKRTAFGSKELELLVAATQPVGALLEKLRTEEDLRAENRTLFKTLSDSRKIIGQSKAVVGVLDFIRRAAPTAMTVLIHGETGTGKELVASAIHYSSPRRGRTFVAINCAALPENLVESEIFGHERGAFTGAVTRKKGRFELADGGTVFLDEVGELSLACQAKLLRLLEEKVFERVGGVESIKVDLRIVAATNKTLAESVSSGAFREDLFYRLNVLAVTIPPLRERAEDIPLLAEHFLREATGGKKTLSRDALARLVAYGWPGNVRQLRNVVESASVLGRGLEIGPEDLVLPEANAKAESAKSSPQDTVSWEPMSLEELERLHIERVLKHTGGNKKKAAEILGIERCTLYAKIRHFRL